MATHQSHEYILPNKSLAIIQTLHLNTSARIQQQLATAPAPPNTGKNVITEANTGYMKANYAFQGKKSTGVGFLQIDGAVDDGGNQGVEIDGDGDVKEQRKRIRKRGWGEMMDSNNEEPRTVFYNAAAGKQIDGHAGRWRVKRVKVTEMNKDRDMAITIKMKTAKGNKARSEGPSEDIEEESMCESWEYETASEDENEDGDDADDEEEEENEDEDEEHGDQAEQVVEEEEIKELVVEKIEEPESEISKLVVKMSVEEKVEKWRETFLVRSSRGKRQRA